MKKVLVIGSNSFSGSDFIDLLLEEKRFQVIGVSRSEEKPSLFLPYKRHQSHHFKFHQIDLNKNLPDLFKILDDFRPEYVVNFAAQSEVGPSWDNPDHWFITNAVALTRLANYLKDQPYLKKYVHISSPEVYGTCTGNLFESAPLNPSTPYAASKASGDLSLFTYAKNFNFPLVMVRATNVYGPCQQLFKIIPKSIINFKLGNKIQLHGGGAAVKSYIYIRDVSIGEMNIMEQGEVGEIYHLSPDQGVSVKNLVSTICKKLHLNFEDVTENVEERLGQDKAYTIDSTKARKAFDWKPQTDLETGLNNVVQWVEQNFEEIQNESLSYVHKA